MPGGYFLTTVMTNKWEDNLFGKKIFGSLYQNFMKKKQEHYHLLNLNQWQEMFSETGFKTEKIAGYLNEETVARLDIAHYLSIPALLSRRIKFFFYEKIKIKKICPVPPDKAAGLFFVLQKKSTSPPQRSSDRKIT